MFKRVYLPLFLILLAVMLRVLRHSGILDLPPNFAPIVGIALFAGTYLTNRCLAIIIPLSAMILSDIFIGFYDLRILGAVYFSFIIAGILGLWIKRKKTVSRIAGATLMASLFFFCLTNYAVWLFSGMYSFSLAGLFECFLMALPFFKWSLLSDLFYVLLLFSLYEIMVKIYAYKLKVVDICYGSNN